MGKTINIGGRIHNPEVGNVVTGANEVLDDTKGKKQSVINSETDAELLRLENEKQDNLSFDNTPTENSTNPITSGGVYASELLIHQVIETILALIPSAASALNQLADKSFVNSTVATNTATFRGTYNVVTDLGLAYNASHQDIATALLSHIATADNNDYAFVQIPVSGTSEDIRVTERYKFNGEAWAYEYDLNNSGFTAAQWAAINSGITALLVEKLGALPTAAELATALAGKQATLTFDNAPVSGSDNPVKSGGLYELFAAIDAKFPDNASANNKLVAEDRLAAYVAAIIGALDATYNVTSTDGHVTFRMTQTNGVIASVQILTSDIASASALTTLGGRVSTNETDIANLQAAYAGLTQSDVIIVNGALPSSGQQQNKIYRQPDPDHTPPQFYSDYMWNGSTWVLMATYNNAIDDIPTMASENLVKSGGVFSGLSFISQDVNYNADKNLDTGKYILPGGTGLGGNPAWNVTEMCPVQEGDVWLLTAYSSAGSVCPLWGYSDTNRSNPTPLVSEPYNTYRTNVEVTIPSGVKFIQGCGQNNFGLSLSKKNNLQSQIDKNKTDADTKINNLASDIENEEKEIVQIGTNFQHDVFDKITNNVYIVADGSGVAANNSWCVSEYYPVVKGQRWVYSGKSNAEGITPVWGYSDKNRSNPVALIPAAFKTWSNELVTIPEGVNYIQAQSNNDVSYAMFNISGVKNVLTYGGSSGSFRDFLANNIVKPSVSNQYIIFVEPGIYDLTNEITQEEISGGTYAGIFIPDYTTVIGKAGAGSTIFTLDIASTAISTFNLGGTCKLKGLTIIGKHCRYAIHDDYSRGNGETERIMENCIVETIDSTYGWAYGGGCRSGQKYIYKNCIFNGNGGGYLMHTNVDFTQNTEITLENCVCISKDSNHPERAIELRGLAGLSTPVSNPVMNYVTIKNCKASGLNLVGVAESDFDLEIYISGTELQSDIEKTNTDYSPVLVSGNVLFNNNKPYWWDGSNWRDANGNILS